MDGLIPRNPFGTLKPPRVHRVEADYLTTGEFTEFVRFVPEDWKPLEMTFAYTGMRFGEATALTGADVDFVNKTIRVSKAWSNGVLDTPKTRGSVRTIAAPESLLRLLTHLVVAAGRDGLLFTLEDGGRVTNGRFHELVWSPARLLANGQTGKGTSRLLEQLDGVDGPAEPPLGKMPRVHDLRHSNATWLLEKGVGMDLVSRHLGHASIVTTIDVYGHVSRARQRAGADALDQLFTTSAMPDPR